MEDGMNGEGAEDAAVDDLNASFAQRLSSSPKRNRTIKQNSVV